MLECSGLSRPGPILRSLGPLAPHGLRVRVVATCDAAQAAERAAHFEEFAAQIAAADTVVFTKLDQTPPEAALALVESINPLATTVLEADCARRALAAFTAPPGRPSALPEGRRARIPASRCCWQGSHPRRAGRTGWTGWRTSPPSPGTGCCG
ncbi:GTP-binding protein [Teichococcus aestuarii]|uniref:GTP-binding protein n=1 Tax=Teichococcus aestuarii TaxID=568898 RepID=UPI003611A7A6